MRDLLFATYKIHSAPKTTPARTATPCPPSRPAEDIAVVLVLEIEAELTLDTFVGPSPGYPPMVVTFKLVGSDVMVEGATMRDVN